VAGAWRRPHNEQLYNLYASQNIIQAMKSRRIGWVGHVACMEDRRNACYNLVGKPEGKRPLGRSSRRWEDNIRMDLRKIGWKGVDLMHVAYDRDQWRALVNTVMNLRVS